jgi:hypothetical protein
MSDYTKFKIMAENDHKIFRVIVKGWFGIWLSGYVWTNYFGISYLSHEEALLSIEKYKNRFTEVSV